MASRAAAQSLLSSLSVDHPEWRPLLVLIGETLREIDRAPWSACVPVLEHHGGDRRPLLDGAVIRVARKRIERWVRRILETAAEAGIEVNRLVTATAAGRLDSRHFFELSVSQHVDRLDELARVHEDERGVVRALAPLIAMPMLRACHTAWADRIPRDWAHGYCPICGGWPALAESRGLEGNRYLRCGACGSGWRIQLLRCPFCREDDHDKLGSLVSARSLEQQRVDVCDGCRRYVKTITTLTPIRPHDVVQQDLATLALDVAALERDYVRPTPTHRVAVRVVTETSRVRDLLGLRS